MKTKQRNKRIKKVALDCNIFIYYFEEHSTFGGYAKKIFDNLDTKVFQGVTSIISLIELLSKKNLPDRIAKNLEKDFLEIPNLSTLEVNQAIATKAAHIRRTYGFRLPDALYLATAMEANVDAFITNDQKLQQCKELNVLMLSSL